MAIFAWLGALLVLFIAPLHGEVSSIRTFPGGNEGEVQFKKNGLFGGDSDFTFSTSTNRMTVSSAAATYAIISTAAITQIKFGDGTSQTTAGISGGDNLGNHTATMTITAPYGIGSTTGVFSGGVSASSFTATYGVVAATVTVSSLTSGRIPYAGTAGLLQDLSTFTFNGSTLTAPILSVSTATSSYYYFPLFGSGGRDYIVQNTSSSVSVFIDGSESMRIVNDASSGRQVQFAQNPSFASTRPMLAGLDAGSNFHRTGISFTLNDLDVYSSGSIAYEFLGTEGALRFNSNGSASSPILRRGSGSSQSGIYWPSGGAISAPNVALGAYGIDGINVSSFTITHYIPTVQTTTTISDYLRIPYALEPTVSAVGEIAIDSATWAANRGAPVFYDGTSSATVVAALSSDAPTNGQVPKWNTGGTITWEEDGGGDNLGNHTATTTLNMAASQILVTTGSASAPSILFPGATNTGFYQAGANRIGFTTEGTLFFTIGDNASGPNQFLIDQSGDGTRPEVANIDDPDTGISFGNNAINFLTGGSGNGIINNNGTYVGAAGNAGSPSLSRITDGDTGFSWPSANNMVWSAGGTEIIRITSASAQISTGTFITGPDNGVGETITINATQANVTASDTFLSMRSTSGEEANIQGTAAAGVIAYNTFTGSHWTRIIGKTKPEVFTPLCSTGQTFSSKEQLVTSEVCKEGASKAILGFYGGTDNKGNDMAFALGTGYAWVKNAGQDVEIGDWLWTSPDAGLVEIQGFMVNTTFTRDNQQRNSTAAKALQPIKWKKNEKKRKIAVTYHAG